MSKDLRSNPPTSDDENVAVIGQLRLDGRQYQVIRLPANGRVMETPLLWRFEIAGKACAIVPGETDSPGSEPDPVDILTAREIQIATLVAIGRLNKQIAGQLHISEWTVATHLRRICAKLQVHTRAAMVFRCASLIRSPPN